MGDNHEAIALGHAQQHAPFLIPGMFWVGDRERQGIAKGGRGFLKRDTVLPEVRGGLLLIPLKSEPHNRIPFVTLPDLHESGLTTIQWFSGGAQRRPLQSQVSWLIDIARPADRSAR
jgi:hypothetical protein